MKKPICNIAGYQFLELSNLPAIQTQLRDAARAHALKGTILLAPEGINLMLAGREEALVEFIHQLNQLLPVADIQYKKNYSDSIPFQRLFVKIKKEIIAFGVPGISPVQLTGKRLSPREFKAWLDAGKAMTVIDTRNRCEIAVGKFDQAIDFNIDHFRDFPKAAQQFTLPAKEQPLVLYCTGGIRCEKASAFMLQQGFKEVYQLEGGILNYFAECGGSHYSGQCFVFDERSTVGAE